MLSAHTPLPQSSPLAHGAPASQGLQSPPQSTSVSDAFCTPSPQSSDPAAHSSTSSQLDVALTHLKAGEELREVIAVDPAGRLWVRTRRPEVTAGTVYDVFNDRGELISWVSIPAVVLSGLFGLTELIAGDDDGAVNAEKLANVILRDFALTGNLLKLVNSAFYGKRVTEITSVSQAVVFLGVETVRVTANSLALFGHMKGDSGTLKDSMTKSFLSGLIARHQRIAVMPQPHMIDGDARRERAGRFVIEKLRQRRGRDAPAPVFTTNPVADETLAEFRVRPCADVACDISIEDDRAGNAGRIR